MSEPLWNPPWRPRHVSAYVEGEWTVRVQPLPGEEPDPQHVRARCHSCGDTWEGRCTTGAVRAKIITFATLHTHEDVFERVPQTMRKTT